MSIGTPKIVLRRKLRDGEKALISRALAHTSARQCREGTEVHSATVKRWLTGSIANVELLIKVLNWCHQVNKLIASQPKVTL